MLPFHIEHCQHSALGAKPKKLVICIVLVGTVGMSLLAHYSQGKTEFSANRSSSQCDLEQVRERTSGLRKCLIWATQETCWEAWGQEKKPGFCRIGKQHERAQLGTPQTSGKLITHKIKIY